MANFISNAFMLPNDLVDKGFMAQMRGAALPCYLYIVRKTRGWNKTDDDISISQLVEGTGYKKDAVLAGIDILLGLGIIEKITYVNRPSNYTLTDNIIAVGKTDTEQSAVGKTDSETESAVGNSDTKSGSAVGKTDKLLSEKPTHNNNIKTNTKTKGNFSEEFEIFWNAYPTCKRKSDKSGTFKTFEKYTRVISLEKLIAILNAFKLDSQWIKNDGEYIPAPSAWLNKKHWENDFWLKAAGLVEQQPQSAETPEYANPQRRHIPTMPKRFKGMNA
ncbi:replication protein [Acinetobacter baumannii]|uniref:replication protein n=1 Tax=Acinetobacter TaxID=469 RepID=UPI00026E1CB5|nr:MULTISPECIES: replication protein [Acinetobacter]AYX95773.1 replication protein [Acinetobacter sp. FDAARGOS_493]EHU1229620.1 replication protein [Acinetobacter baumannii]EHU1232948.1 replication protein [Acinetobacter baumannii]EHU1245320.1 replication protein [Acinetobacter baumannii]EHU1249617.1 replication protein [Acinetobacter baumannii]